MNEIVLILMMKKSKKSVIFQIIIIFEGKIIHTNMKQIISRSHIENYNFSLIFHLIRQRKEEE